MKHNKEHVRLRHAIYGEVNCDLATYYDDTRAMLAVKLSRPLSICGTTTKTLTVSRHCLTPVQYRGGSARTAKAEPFVPDGSNVKDHGDLYRAVAYNAEIARKKAAKARLPRADQDDVSQQVWVLALERIREMGQTFEPGRVLNNLVNVATRQHYQDQPSRPISIPNSKAARDATKDWQSAEISEADIIATTSTEELLIAAEDERRWLTKLIEAQRKATASERKVIEALIAPPRTMKTMEDAARVAKVDVKTVKRLKAKWKDSKDE